MTLLTHRCFLVVTLFARQLLQLSDTIQVSMLYHAQSSLPCHQLHLEFTRSPLVASCSSLQASTAVTFVILRKTVSRPA